MTPGLDIAVRRSTPADSDAVRRVVAAAFVDDPEVAPLQDALAARDDNVGFVAELAGVVIGHVGLTRCWIDAEPQLVEALVLSPLSVSPESQDRGVGRALCARAAEHAREVGVPAVFLEGDPAYYSRLGWRPAAEIGVTPASGRVPAAAFQHVRLAAYEDWMRGALVYPETFWQCDAVGLRGDVLAEARALLGP